MTLHTDCRHFRTAEPCGPHKRSGVRCGACAEYDPVETRILIVKLGALGDILRTTSCLAPLKARHPHSHVTWVTRSNAHDLLAAIPEIDRVLTINEPYLELLMAEEFDLVIGPETDLLSASIVRLARSAEKRGFVANGRGGLHPIGEAALEWWRTSIDDKAKQVNRRTYGEWLYSVCSLRTPVALPSLSVGAIAHARVAAFLAEHRIGPRRVCINTGASGRWREKSWKMAHYRAFGQLLASEAPEMAVILVGGPDEAAFNRDLLSADVGFIDGGTHRSVEEFGALIAACDWLLTPDSLGYHVACAVGTPAVCIAGPTSPWELDRYGRNLVLHSDMPCIACYRAECPLPLTCMDLMTPTAVWAHVRAWLTDGAILTSDRVKSVHTSVDASDVAIEAGVPKRRHALPLSAGPAIAAIPAPRLPLERASVTLPMIAAEHA